MNQWWDPPREPGQRTHPRPLSGSLSSGSGLLLQPWIPLPNPWTHWGTTSTLPRTAGCPWARYGGPRENTKATRVYSGASAALLGGEARPGAGYAEPFPDTPSLTCRLSQPGGRGAEQHLGCWYSGRLLAQPSGLPRLDGRTDPGLCLPMPVSWWAELRWHRRLPRVWGPQDGSVGLQGFLNSLLRFSLLASTLSTDQKMGERESGNRPVSW